MATRRSSELPLWAIDRIPRPLLSGLLILGCMVACSLGMAARRPFILAAEARSENEKIARQYMALKYQNQAMERRVAHYKTDEGREREARSRGYLKAGETRLTFLP